MKLRTLGILGALMLLASIAHAQAIGYYHTGNLDANGANASTTGVEKSVIVINSSPQSSRRFLMASATGYNTAAEVVMCFDSATLPANGSASALSLIAQCPLAAAATTAQPSTCSFSLPQDGVGLVSGLTCACSTTGKLLTLESTASCYFGIGWK